MRPNIVEVTQASRGAANKATFFIPEHTEHTPHHCRFEQNVVIEKVNIGCLTLLNKKVPLFCHSALWQVAMKRHLVTTPLQCSHKRLNLNVLEVSVVILGLIRDDYIEVSKGLA